jgi:hypothetical protein
MFQCNLREASDVYVKWGQGCRFERVLQLVESHIPEGHLETSRCPEDFFQLLEAVRRRLLDVALALQVGYKENRTMTVRKDCSA